jgi:hypothetical protein
MNFTSNGMDFTTDISKGYPCGHRAAATLAGGEESGRDWIDYYTCDTCGTEFGVVIED